MCLRVVGRCIWRICLGIWVDAPDGVRHERIARRDDYQWDVANWEAQERFCKRSWAGLDGFVDQVIVNQ